MWKWKLRTAALASVPDLPGVMAYATTEADAARKVKAIALQVLVSGHD